MGRGLLVHEFSCWIVLIVHKRLPGLFKGFIELFSECEFDLFEFQVFFNTIHSGNVDPISQAEHKAGYAYCDWRLFVTPANSKYGDLHLLFAHKKHGDGTIFEKQNKLSPEREREREGGMPPNEALSVT